MSYPKEGDTIRLVGDNDADTQDALVRDLLASQFTCTYEVQRTDGGWTEVTQFVFYRDCEWDIRLQMWVGRPG